MKNKILIYIIVTITILCCASCHTQNETAHSEKYYITYSTPMKAQYYGDGETHLIIADENGNCKIENFVGFEWNNVSAVGSNLFINTPSETIVYNEENRNSLSNNTIVNGGSYPQSSGALNKSGLFYSLLNKGMNKSDEYYQTILRYGNHQNVFETNINHYIFSKGDNQNNTIYLLKRDTLKRTFYFSIVEFVDDSINEKENELFSYSDPIDYMPLSNIVIKDTTAYCLIMKVDDNSYSLMLLSISLDTQSVIDEKALLLSDNLTINSLYLMNANAIHLENEKIHFVLDTGEGYYYNLDSKTLEHGFLFNLNNTLEKYHFERMVVFKHESIYLFRKVLDKYIVEKYTLDGQLIDKIMLQATNLSNSEEYSNLLLYDFFVN